MILPEMEKRERGAPLGDGIVGHRLVDLGQKVRWDLVGLTGTGGSCSMRVHEALKETKNPPSRKEGNGLMTFKSPHRSKEGFP